MTNDTLDKIRADLRAGIRVKIICERHKVSKSKVYVIKNQIMPSKRTRRKFTEDQKRALLNKMKTYLDDGFSMQYAGREIGISSSVLLKWVKQYSFDIGREIQSKRTPQYFSNLESKDAILSEKKKQCKKANELKARGVHIDDITNLLGVTQRTLSRWRTKTKLNIVKGITPDMWSAMQKDLQECKLTLTSIALKYGVSYSGFKLKLDKEGVNTKAYKDKYILDKCDNVNELVQSGIKVSDAIKQVGISRTCYYKIRKS